MEPTLTEGRLVWVNHWAYFFQKPKIGDVVVFDWQGKNFVKRITEKDNNGYFLSGDKKEDSLDSRKLGLIPRDKIQGKILFLDYF